MMTGDGMQVVSGKYHTGSIVAIFFALGVGILIGGTLGQQWMFQTEQQTVGLLMDKYERQIVENRQLQENAAELQLKQRSYAAVFQDKYILWARPSEADNAFMPQMMAAAGAEWTETWLRRPSEAIEASVPSIEEENRVPGTHNVQNSSQDDAHVSSRELEQAVELEHPIPDIIVITDLDRDMFLFIQKMLEEQGNERSTR